jgi:hypothetical protein
LATGHAGANEGPGFTDREHRLDAWRKHVAFLLQYLDR